MDAALVAAVDGIIAAQGRIDVLINAAGYGQFGAIEEVPMALARRQFEVNVIGAARLCQLVLPHMRARGAGRIVMFSSVGGKVFAPLGGWYTASKFALEGLSDSLRNEVSPFGIAVVVIQPGAIETEFNLSLAGARQISGQGAYAPLVAAFERMLAKVGAMSPPAVITDVVVKALKARRPKARYHGGKLSGPTLFLRHWLPDGVFDRLVMANFRTK
jgi:NAD(P)-dependent dehydrogenase (short-subunit alcohol dehydrogenase family)